MNKEKIKKLARAITVICAAIAVLSALYNYLLPVYLARMFAPGAGNAGSIGVIGGADGPTAIFVSGYGSAVSVTAVSGILALAGIAYLIVLRCRKSQ